ncbi:MAG: DUF2089 domain-containing protein [Chloroflexi bacterium]|nr:DUF2089 domain-containing protein [Chloroflexota bacterium]
MNNLIGKCPICGEELVVTRLECRSCGTDIGGQFSIDRLSRLGAEDIQFVELFIKNRGNAYKVGEELEVPYSAIRARLTQIIRAMGYEPGAEPKDDLSGADTERRRAILDKVAARKLSAEDAVKMLQGDSAT